jgi:TusA-related sulfurtransferase
MATIKCKGVFGLGITSLPDFVKYISKYKVVRQSKVGYVTTTTFVLPKAALIVFSSVKEVIRFHNDINENHVIVVSDTPSLIKDIPNCVALDYNQNRSFEFNFKELDVHPVLSALKSKKQTVECRLVSFDNLGYHVNKIKEGDSFINSYISVTSSLPIEERDKLRGEMITMLTSKNPSVNRVVEYLKKVNKDHNLVEARNFCENLIDQYEAYHKALNSNLASAAAAKKYNVNAYGVSYFKRIISSNNTKIERDKRNNVTKSKVS